MTEELSISECIEVIGEFLLSTPLLLYPGRSRIEQALECLKAIENHYITDRKCPDCPIP